ncbi:MAG: hypothetical protein GSR74_04560 [Desulfurococcales archaeon]|nr:hypothetical protein [Desulfurococcales archaeon]
MAMRRGECIARIVVETAHARILYDAVEPDNRDAPPHIKVSCTPKDNALECTVRVTGCGNPKRVLTLRNTVDDLLLALRSALEALDLPK